MGKLNKKFIDKKTAVKFKLVYRSSEDPNQTDDPKDDRVFRVIEDRHPENQTEAEKLIKEKILSQFKDYDLGKFDAPKLVHKEEETFVPQELQNRDDLWINHIMKKKEADKKAKSLNQTEAPKKEEEWEDDEDFEYDVEEIEEMEDEEYEDIEEEEEEVKEEKVEKKITVEKPKTFDAHPLDAHSKLAEKIFNTNDPINLKAEFDVNPDVRMKYYDNNGMLIDGYDYYQHIAKDDSEGIVTAVFKAVYDKPPELAPDYDYDPEKMNAEQKEVFEALQYEGADLKYENLEDDFVNMANCGEEILKEKEKKVEKIVNKETHEKDLKKGIKDFIESKDKKKKDKKKRVAEIDEKALKNVEKEFESEEDLPQMPDILSKHDFKKIVGETHKIHGEARREEKWYFK